MRELASAVQRRHVGDLSAFGTVGEWHGMCELAFDAAWERHGMCELALIVLITVRVVRLDVQILLVNSFTFTYGTTCKR
jgi:hypothetical protein